MLTPDVYIMKRPLADHIRNVSNFPKEGIQFKDITTLMKDPQAFRQATEQLLALTQEQSIDKVAGIESRGFFFGPLLAERLAVGFVPIRKPGKLPAPTVEAIYTLEYGTDQLAIHQDAVQAGERVLLHDDLLATGGTARAAAQLIEQLGGKVVQVNFLIELCFLDGRKQLSGYPVQSVIQYYA